ncbi:hypothetical protein HOY82DRAFT_606320 [Tuber indicum]|nr:hypothetical protein HOY82DRAFT_606320 [Tuber indicum]
MSPNRSLLRNFLFYDATKPDEDHEVLGGSVQNGSITEGFERRYRAILYPEQTYRSTKEYTVFIVMVGDEPWIPRLISHNTSGSDDRFYHEANNWGDFQAAHIFPAEHESLWTQFLLDTAIHTKFDQYLISVNPDDPVYRNPDDPHSVSDKLLRWHFIQSILANVRGAGHPILEHDFPPGHDMAGEILAGPHGQKRFELEIASRLRGLPKANFVHHGENLRVSV